jgi:hypothetical protein
VPGGEMRDFALIKPEPQRVFPETEFHNFMLALQAPFTGVDVEVIVADEAN